MLLPVRNFLFAACMSSIFVPAHPATAQSADDKATGLCGTAVGSKANDGGASRWCSFPHDGGFSPLSCESAADQYREGFIE